MGEQSTVKITIRQILADISPGFPTAGYHVHIKAVKCPQILQLSNVLGHFQDSTIMLL